MLQNFLMMGRWKQFHLFLAISWWAVWTLWDEFILTESDRRYGPRPDLVPEELVALGMSSCFFFGSYYSPGIYYILEFSFELLKATFGSVVKLV